MLNLVMDAGNTRIKIALFEAHRMVEFIQMTDWDQEKIIRMITRHPEIESGILSTVRNLPDDQTARLADHLDPLYHFSVNLPLPIRINYQSTDTLGNDRIAAAVGAFTTQRGHDLLVIDAGTALTMDLITADGVFQGGNISPGIRMRFRALHNFTNRLPLVEPNDSAPEVGHNTTEALQAGVCNGVVYEVDNFINSLKNKYNGLMVIMTGGDAFRLTKKLKKPIFVDPYLVLNGLNQILMHQAAIGGSGHNG